jgi:formyltetrahydrofolate hydrolase
VKIIGATSHYVTEELDEGPIIEQDITRVSHINSVDDFIMKGKDLSAPFWQEHKTACRKKSNGLFQ